MGKHTHPTATAEGRESEPALRQLLAKAERWELEEFIILLSKHDCLHSSFGAWYEWITPETILTIWKEWDEDSSC